MRVQLVEHMKHEHCVKRNLRQTLKKSRAILAQCVREADTYIPTVDHRAYGRKNVKRYISISLIIRAKLVKLTW
jgi:hypothetical protein